jgi:ribosomal protein L11 methylase PrmA
VEDYRAATGDGIYERLIGKDLLIAHAEVDPAEMSVGDALVCLEHPKIPMVSYPWEWPFSLLKDAALLHLDIMEELLPRGYWLRDANVFNIQFDGHRLKLIDTLSIGRREANRPWVAYKQFCSHFLAPLAVAAKSDVRLLALWRSYLDGFPLDLAVKLLPGSARLNPRLFMHLYLHASMQQSADSKERLHEAKPKVVRVSDTALLGLIRSLRKAISGLAYRPNSEIWQGYTEIRTYDAEDVTAKSAFINSVVEEMDPGVVWDFGGNTGEFSELAARRGAFVVSVDFDPACTEFLYTRLRQGQVEGRILPLTMDLSNPSPGLGFNQGERYGLKERGPADLLFALALIHHLVFSASIPLENVALWFSQLTRRLLIEFVPETDPMVKKLLVNRGDDHLPYSMEAFKQGFNRYFSIEKEQQLQNGRSLFVLRNNSDL